MGEHRCGDSLKDGDIHEGIKFLTLLVSLALGCMCDHLLAQKQPPPQGPVLRERRGQTSCQDAPTGLEIKVPSVVDMEEQNFNA